jgi:predicted GNAT family acetyltransferase
MNSTINITDNTNELRFETPVGDKLAFIAYRWEHGKLALMHTEVPEEAEGKGIASQLAEFAFEQAKQQQRKVLVFCPYVSAWLNRHPEYRAFVEKDYNDRTS